MALFKAKAKAYVYGEGSTKTYLINSTEFTTSMTFVQGDTVFFPDLGKGYLVGTTLTFANYTAFSAGGVNDPTETTEAITAGTSTDNTLRWSGSAWVETAALKIATGATGTVTAAGDMIISGSTASTTKDTGALVLSSGGLGVELAINAGTAIAAGTTVTGGTGVTATTGNVVATAGAVSANTTVTAGTNLVATGVLDVNGTSASDIAGPLGVGASGTTGTVTLTHTSGTTVAIAPTTTNNQLNLGTYAVPTADAHVAAKKYVDDQVSAVATSMTWKGNATVITDTLVIRDLSGNSHTLVATNDISGALSSLVAADQWWFEGDDDVLRGVGVAGDLASASPIVTNTNTTGLSVGMYVSNNNGYIPNSTTIISINSGTSFTMSANATATSAGAFQTFYDASQISVDMNRNAHTVTYGVQMPASGYILNTSGTDNYFVVTASVLGTAVTAVAGFAFGVIKDLIQPIHAQESAAIYVANTSNNWVKIGEFTIGQIQDGLTNNTLPTWSTADSVWKQNSGLTLSGTAITGTAATALSITAASTQDVTISATGSGGDISISSTAGNVSISGVTQTAIGAAGFDANLIFGVTGAAALRAESGQGLNIRADVNKSFLHNTATMKTVTGLLTITGDITTSSTTISNISAADIAKLSVGMRLNGTGLPSDNFIVSISTSSVVVSIAATATTAALSITVKAYSIVDAQYIREEVVLRNYNSALADAGTLALAVGTGADISVKVVGSGANANKVYTSKITAGLLTATTVDATEYSIVGNLTGITIAVTATGSVITVTVTNGSGAAAAVGIQALPLN